MYKRLLYTIFILSLVSLSGCTQIPQQKTDFVVSTKSLEDFSKEILLKKSGKILGTANLTVTSQVSGRVKTIFKKDGDSVVAGDVVLKLDDSVAQYGLQLKSAKNSLGRAVLQYNQTKVSVEQGLSTSSNALQSAQDAYNTSQESLLLQLDVQKKSLLSSLDAILHQLDTYLGVSSQYKQTSRPYDIYLGANNSSQRVKTERALLTLYNLRDQVKNIISSSPSFDTVVKSVSIMDSSYNQARALLDEMNQVLVNSIPGAILPQSTIDGYKSTIDGLKASLQGSYASFTAYHTQVKAQNMTNQEHILTNDVGVKNAQTIYNSVVQNKDIQVNMSKTAIADAQIMYQNAQVMIDNLSPKAPLDGIIANVLVDPGQEVGPGTPLFTFTSNGQQMVEVYLSSEEIRLVTTGTVVYVHYDNQVLTGNISSLSSVADASTLYKVVIGVTSSTDLLGDIATVFFSVKIPTLVVPLNVVTPLDTQRGFLWILEGTGIQKREVRLGPVWNEWIQITSPLSSGLQIIVSDISNFDPEKFVLKRQ